MYHSVNHPTRPLRLTLKHKTSVHKYSSGAEKKSKLVQSCKLSPASYTKLCKPGLIPFRFLPETWCSLDGCHFRSKIINKETAAGKWLPSRCNKVPHKCIRDADLRSRSDDSADCHGLLFALNLTLHHSRVVPRLTTSNERRLGELSDESLRTAVR